MADYVTGELDAGIPGVRRFKYWLLCQVNRRPFLWRAIGWLLRKWPSIAAALRVAARRESVTRLLDRSESFLSTAHAPNLVAGTFLIGMENNARYESDKALLLNVMVRVDQAKDFSIVAARERFDALAEQPEKPFDLIEGYLMWIVHESVAGSFGTAANTIVGGGSAVATTTPDPQEILLYLRELRYIAAQLFAGTSAPDPVQRRAETSAASLRNRIAAAIPALSASWCLQSRFDRDEVARVAIGLAWVSHPVTVQSGALMIVELLGRVGTHEHLRALVRDSKDPWQDPTLREELRRHVLELMRFRPVFPALGRDVPRQTFFDAGDDKYAVCPAGTSATAVTISALFDPTTVESPRRYCPERPQKTAQVPGWDDFNDRYLMFGHGDRQCPGKLQAVEILVSGLIGLLLFEAPLRFDDQRPAGKRLVYDGPMICEMWLKP